MVYFKLSGLSTSLLFTTPTPDLTLTSRGGVSGDESIQLSSTIPSIPYPYPDFSIEPIVHTIYTTYNNISYPNYIQKSYRGQNVVFYADALFNPKNSDNVTVPELELLKIIWAFEGVTINNTSNVAVYAFTKPTTSPQIEAIAVYKNAQTDSIFNVPIQVSSNAFKHSTFLTEVKEGAKISSNLPGEEVLFYDTITFQDVSGIDRRWPGDHCGRGRRFHQRYPVVPGGPVYSSVCDLLWK